VGRSYMSNAEPVSRVSQVIRVLIVDDSAYVRKTVRQILTRSPFIEVVGAARDGREALELVEELQPDVVTCDLNMPEMDGLTFVREQMARRPLPIVIMSIASESGEQALAAIDAGAMGFVQKPTALATDKLLDVSSELIEMVKAAAAAPPRLQTPVADPVVVPAARPGAGRIDVAVIGASTGGPQALKFLLSHIPADFPVPIGIVLHMPVGYTALFAQRLDESSPLRVIEAGEGQDVVAGTVYLAPAGRHLLFRRVSPDRVTTHLSVRPLDTPHRPAVDVLFQSAAEAYGGRVLGTVLTGMGSDGRAGSAWIKAQGGRVITETEASCVVYGMPRTVVEAGLSDGSYPLELMPRAIMENL